MRALLPEPGPVDPVVAHAAIARSAPAGRPWLALNMVASLDGAIAFDGLSHQLSGPADKAVFGALRSVADVILVAAGTARVERYRAPRSSPERQRQRRDRAQMPFARLAVVSRSLDLDPAGPMFTDLPAGPVQPEAPLVYTVADAPAARRRALATVAEVIDAGDGWVSVPTMLADLGDRGVGVALCEGGPMLVGQLVAAAMVDELNLTTSPLLVGGDTFGLGRGGPVQSASMALAHLWEADSFLFARYVRS